MATNVDSASKVSSEIRMSYEIGLCDSLGNLHPSAGSRVCMPNWQPLAETNVYSAVH